VWIWAVTGPTSDPSKDVVREAEDDAGDDSDYYSEGRCVAREPLIGGTPVALAGP